MSETSDLPVDFILASAREYVKRNEVRYGDSVAYSDKALMVKNLLALIDRGPTAVLPQSKKIADFIRTHDPFGDSFSQHDLMLIEGKERPNEFCEVCGGDFSSANPPVYNCPERR